METLQIDIVSDVACPWCAIGYKRLEKAMAELEGEMEFAVTWHAFRLNPDLPPEGEPIVEHLCSKYGRSPAQIEESQKEIMGIARGLGLNFSKADVRSAHDTTDAHRLLVWAREQGRQTDLNLALFDAYFGHAQNPSDPHVLRHAAESVGLPGEEAEEVVRSGRYRREVEQEEARFREAGISGVPAFIVDGQYLISGAQEPRTLLTAFRNIVAERGTGSASVPSG